MKKILFVAAIAMLSSCATLMRKEFNEDVNFTANGEDNVDVYIDGEYKGPTPVTVNLDAREKYEVKYGKPGFSENQYELRGSVQPKYVVADIVMGGVVFGPIPIIVDAVTDKWRSFDQREIDYRYTRFDWKSGSYTSPDGNAVVNVPDTDGDGINDKSDDCPKIAGLAEFNGCPDTDGDGVMDKVDGCPKIKGSIKNNGCPDGELLKDTDGDGVYDDKDACPKIAGLLDLNGCPDRDGDGIVDNEDACPDVKGIKKLKGCPEEGFVDTDGDGIIDTEDDCPNVKGILKLKGCPEADTDGDGIVDSEDACPNVKGIKKLKGCPEEQIVDTDGDGIADSEDACPKVAGIKSLNGCPKIVDDSHGADGKIIPKVGDHGQILNWRDIRNQDLPDVKGKMFEIKNLNFETGSAKIKSSSYKELDEVVAFLNAAPDAIIDVEGHTDSQGSESGNLSLSQKRAKSVVAYLVSKGISASRLFDHGYGEAKPVATNETAEGRATNRRVEFHFK